MTFPSVSAGPDGDPRRCVISACTCGGAEHDAAPSPLPPAGHLRDDQARERLADVLAENVATGIDRKQWPEFWAEVADIAVTTLRAAGWQP